MKGTINFLDSDRFNNEISDGFADNDKNLLIH